MLYWKTIERFLELIGYPLGFKKNPKGNVSKVTVNSVSANSFGTTSGSHTLTSDEYKRLMSLLSSSGRHAFDIQRNIANCTVAKVNQIRSYKITKTLIIHDMLVFLGYHDSIQKSLVRTCSMFIFFDNPRSNEPYDEEKDNNSNGDGTKTSSKVNVESKSCLADAEDSTDLIASTSEKNVQNTLLSDNENIQPLGSIIAKGQLEDVDATSDDDKYNSEGEYFIEFGQMFGSDDLSPDRIVNEEIVRRSSRRSKFPSMLELFELDGKVKYGLNRYVNYVNLSEAYCFVTNLNKTIEPKSYREA
uniref:Ribonuclease H-like domain-containing protein n=1 Tax=Tanacetum cinerariifolium TaxID=118510 RepID=A0A6L2MU42_TANCI|nr:ribonuclease H-like domain-containing protein [Tanacetum cinerariifolium]